MWKGFLGYSRSQLLAAVVSISMTGMTHAALLEVPIGISPVMSSAAVYIAAERGYFEEQGIKPMITAFDASGAKMVPILATGELFVAGGNVNAGLYNAIASDVPIKIVADKGTVTRGHGYLALLVRKDLFDSGRYKSYASLKGMKMAVTAKGVSQEIVTERYLKAAGLTLADIELLNLPYKDMNLAFANQGLDATVQIEPFVSQAVADRLAVRVEGNDVIYPDQQSAVMFYSPVFVEKHPEAARKFMIAYVKGMRDFNDAFEHGKGKAALIELLVKAKVVKDAAIAEKMVPVGLHPDGKMNVQSLQDDLRWFNEKGYVAKAPDLAKVVDESYVDHAVKVLGPYKTPH